MQQPPYSTIEPLLTGFLLYEIFVMLTKSANNLKKVIDRGLMNGGMARGSLTCGDM